MRTITLIVIHCSAVKPDQMSSAAQIDSWHRKQGWKLGIGYHYVVRRNGEIEPGRPEWLIGAHCKNHNAHSIGVCYEGGLDIRGQPADTAEDCHALAAPTVAPKLSQGPHRRSSRPEPAEGLSLHRQRRPRIRRPTAEKCTWGLEMNRLLWLKS